jgi:formamidopyrimidine-DNA glycosylase
MPELAEVEYFRRRWDVGVGQKILELKINGGKRVFRGTDPGALQRLLPGAKLLGSEARGKQMLFRFSKDAWLGLHLGMTGQLRHEPAGFAPGKHDHMVLRQARQSLVFSDPRLFGRVLFHHGASEPGWWTQLPPALTSADFTLERMGAFLQRRARSPLKGVLLRQEFFIGIGNWMADEILWRAKIHPRRAAGRLSAAEAREVWRATRLVCAGALRIVAKDYSDPPLSWLFRHRWENGGRCPKDGRELARAAIGGRTTAWCPKCQPK